MPKPSYPVTRREKVEDVLHGIRISDPFRWLEEDTEEVRAWDAEQNALTETILSAWPYRDKLRQSIRAALTAGAAAMVDVPRFHGKFTFQLGVEPGKRQAVLQVSDESQAPSRVLVDPNAMPEGSSLDWYFPSPDGTYVAFGISRDGDEQSVLHVVETDTGRTLPERIPFTSFARVAWLPDSSGFYYSGGTATDLEDAQKWLFFHQLGETAVRKPDAMKFDSWYITPQLSPDGRYLMVITGWETACAAYYKDLTQESDWRPVFQGKIGESYGEFEGDSYLALTTYGAPRGRIVSIPLATASDEQTWTEVVPESEAVLRAFAPVGDKLVISELHQAYARLRVVPREGGNEEIVSLPGKGLISGDVSGLTQHFSVRGSELFFGYTTFVEPLRLYRYDLKSGTLEPQGPEPLSDLSHLTVDQLTFSSHDGTPVTMFLVYRKDLPPDQPHPTLLHGYGGWNIVPAPGYVGGAIAGGSARCVLPFIEAGGVYAFANLRGGAEYGRDWWQAGRLAEKQNTFDDLYAAAEFLIQKGLTTQDKLATMGASNGGLLAAAAVTQRPDLFRAVVSDVPLADMVRAFKDPYLAPYTDEYGDPQDPDMLPILLAYSPVHNVTEGRPYPATLVLCAISDIRCQPWNGRKLVALLQNATTSDAPVLLTVVYGGHGPGLPADKKVERQTTIIGFIMQQLGMRVV